MCILQDTEFQFNSYEATDTKFVTKKSGEFE